MELAAAIAGILSCACPKNVIQETTGQHCKYLHYNAKAKIDELRSKMEELRALVADVKRKLEDTCLQEGKEPTEQVKLWLRHVQSFDNEKLNKLLCWEEERCLCGCLPDYCSRMKLGKLIERRIQKVDELLRRGQFQDDALAHLLLENIKMLPMTVAVGHETTKRKLEEIWEHLMAGYEVQRIGVYGMGGVGKTTILKEINNRLKKEMTEGMITCFDNVVWVTIPKESNPEKLQMAIAKAVRLNLPEDWNMMDKAAELLKSLQRRKRLLLIFDDVWTPFSLEDIGIPAPTRANGCKLILTTRSLKVCRGMETNKEVEVKVLSEEESWTLFTDKVGSVVLQNPEIKIIAREIAKEFGGLPLAIITVGRALRKVSNEIEWQNALTALRCSAANVEGMEELVYSRLRFSYERLKDDTTRSCFLYCALYPEDHQIEAKELIEYWMWEGLLGCGGRIEANIWKGEMILADLKDSCLLDNVDVDGGVECVKMHDLIRDMAIGITSMSPRFIISAGIGVEKASLGEEGIEDVERISMMYNELKCLPSQPLCSKLSSLLLQYSSMANDISHRFFCHMPKLRVLDLSFTGILCIPDSIAELSNLRALLLRSCWNLSSLPSLVTLEALWVLDLSYTHITELPLGMEKLRQLRRLNLSYTKLDSFPKGLLTTLNLLEELLLYRCKCEFGLQFVDELITSRNIVVLEVEFSTSRVFDTYSRSGHWNLLRSFRSGICSYGDDLGKNSIDYIGNFFLSGTPVLLPDRTYELRLLHCYDVDRLSRCLSESMKLKKCVITHCDQMESIIMTGENNLSCLNTLELGFLQNFKSLYKGVMPSGALGALKILQISYCNSLESLLNPRLIEHLRNLEELSVEHCPKLEVVIEEEQSIHNAEVRLSRLKSLKLCDLRELESIYSEEVICISLCTITIEGCNKLRRLPFRISIDEGYQQRQPSITPPIRKIKTEQVWWDSVELANPIVKTFLQHRLELPS
ncbi:putative P-loop containing nucleoside triphosphate hydrolase, leucine-rich repeat domain, L [Rosa chinensis]|uniref:Putative P-loop containing nucleoside triphosphate hydrolase, leucine-rich repeat domain, L n=1 Tax=Rosa chinensis TaxID=74649 RepID=A0A2P6PML3_ROSCH|nr:probable disease resistance protein At4g27220 [Rosa chinensis]PRQ23174.1 putative P-loop containing nucleoside triphosphate hydrolase, leucine-rich repeat domain, L [Rosa chinensis]